MGLSTSADRKQRPEGERTYEQGIKDFLKVLEPGVVATEDEFGYTDVNDSDPYKRGFARAQEMYSYGTVIPEGLEHLEGYEDGVDIYIQHIEDTLLGTDTQPPIYGSGDIDQYWWSNFISAPLESAVIPPSDARGIEGVTTTGIGLVDASIDAVEFVLKNVPGAQLQRGQTIEERAAATDGEIIIHSVEDVEEDTGDASITGGIIQQGSGGESYESGVMDLINLLAQGYDPDEIVGMLGFETMTKPPYIILDSNDPDPYKRGVVRAIDIIMAGGVESVVADEVAGALYDDVRLHEHVKAVLFGTDDTEPFISSGTIDEKKWRVDLGFPEDYDTTNEIGILHVKIDAANNAEVAAALLEQIDKKLLELSDDYDINLTHQYLDGRIVGQAYVDDREILIDISDAETPGLYEATYAHEVAHVIYGTLSEEAKEVFAKAMEPLRGDRPKEYPWTDAEMFAEAFEGRQMASRSVAPGYRTALDDALASLVGAPAENYFPEDATTTGGGFMGAVIDAAEFIISNIPGGTLGGPSFEERVSTEVPDIVVAEEKRQAMRDSELGTDESYKRDVEAAKNTWLPASELVEKYGDAGVTTYMISRGDKVQSRRKNNTKTGTKEYNLWDVLNLIQMPVSVEDVGRMIGSDDPDVVSKWMRDNDVKTQTVSGEKMVNTESFQAALIKIGTGDLIAIGDGAAKATDWREEHQISASEWKKLTAPPESYVDYQKVIDPDTGFETMKVVTATTEPGLFYDPETKGSPDFITEEMTAAYWTQYYEQEKAKDAVDTTTAIHYLYGVPTSEKDAKEKRARFEKLRQGNRYTAEGGADLSDGKLVAVVEGAKNLYSNEDLFALKTAIETMPALAETMSGKAWRDEHLINSGDWEAAVSEGGPLYDPNRQPKEAYKITPAMTEAYVDWHYERESAKGGIVGASQFEEFTKSQYGLTDSEYNDFARANRDEFYGGSNQYDTANLDALVGEWRSGEVAGQTAGVWRAEQQVTGKEWAELTAAPTSESEAGIFYEAKEGNKWNITPEMTDAYLEQYHAKQDARSEAGVFYTDEMRTALEPLAELEGISPDALLQKLLNPSIEHGEVQKIEKVGRGEYRFTDLDLLEALYGTDDDLDVWRADEGFELLQRLPGRIEGEPTGLMDADLGGAVGAAVDAAEFVVGGIFGGIRTIIGLKSASQIAKELGITTSDTNAMFESGQIKGTKVGDSWYSTVGDWQDVKTAAGEQPVGEYLRELPDAEEEAIAPTEAPVDEDALVAAQETVGFSVEEVADMLGMDAQDVHDLQLSGLFTLRDDKIDATQPITAEGLAAYASGESLGAKGPKPSVGLFMETLGYYATAGAVIAFGMAIKTWLGGREESDLSQAGQDALNDLRRKVAGLKTRKSVVKEAGTDIANFVYGPASAPPVQALLDYPDNARVVAADADIQHFLDTNPGKGVPDNLITEAADARLEAWELGETGAVRQTPVTEEWAGRVQAKQAQWLQEDIDLAQSISQKLDNQVALTQGETVFLNEQTARIAAGGEDVIGDATGLNVGELWDKAQKGYVVNVETGEVGLFPKTADVVEEVFDKQDWIDDYVKRIAEGGTATDADDAIIRTLSSDEMMDITNRVVDYDIGMPIVPDDLDKFNRLIDGADNIDTFALDTQYADFAADFDRQIDLGGNIRFAAGTEDLARADYLQQVDLAVKAGEEAPSPSQWYLDYRLRGPTAETGRTANYWKSISTISDDIAAGRSLTDAQKGKAIDAGLVTGWDAEGFVSGKIGADEPLTAWQSDFAEGRGLFDDAPTVVDDVVAWKMPLDQYLHKDMPDELRKLYDNPIRLEGLSYLDNTDPRVKSYLRDLERFVKKNAPEYSERVERLWVTWSAAQAEEVLSGAHTTFLDNMGATVGAVAGQKEWMTSVSDAIARGEDVPEAILAEYNAVRPKTAAETGLGFGAGKAVDPPPMPLGTAAEGKTQKFITIIDDINAGILPSATDYDLIGNISSDPNASAIFKDTYGVAPSDLMQKMYDDHGVLDQYDPKFGKRIEGVLDDVVDEVADVVDTVNPPPMPAGTAGRQEWVAKNWSVEKRIRLGEKIGDLEYTEAVRQGWLQQGDVTGWRYFTGDQLGAAIDAGKIPNQAQMFDELGTAMKGLGTGLESLDEVIDDLATGAYKTADSTIPLLIKAQKLGKLGAVGKFIKGIPDPSDLLEAMVVGIIDVENQLVLDSGRTPEGYIRLTYEEVEWAKQSGLITTEQIAEMGLRDDTSVGGVPRLGEMISAAGELPGKGESDVRVPVDAFADPGKMLRDFISPPWDKTLGEAITKRREAVVLFKSEQAADFKFATEGGISDSGWEEAQGFLGEIPTISVTAEGAEGPQQFDFAIFITDPLEMRPVGQFEPSDRDIQPTDAGLADPDRPEVVIPELPHEPADTPILAPDETADWLRSDWIQDALNDLLAEQADNQRLIAAGAPGSSQLMDLSFIIEDAKADLVLQLAKEQGETLQAVPLPSAAQTPGMPDVTDPAPITTLLPTSKIKQVSGKKVRAPGTEAEFATGDLPRGWEGVAITPETEYTIPTAGAPEVSVTPVVGVEPGLDVLLDGIATGALPVTSVLPPTSYTAYPLPAITPTAAKKKRRTTKPAPVPQGVDERRAAGRAKVLEERLGGLDISVAPDSYEIANVVSLLGGIADGSVPAKSVLPPTSYTSYPLPSQPGDALTRFDLYPRRR